LAAKGGIWYSLNPLGLRRDLAAADLVQSEIMQKEVKAAAVVR
jgi:hypothetical protein